MSKLFDHSGATFSNCRKYRYKLWRIWDPNKPMVMFIGLNPSTANEDTDDPTIRRVMKFAKDWGYGGVYMMNLFAWVTPKPEELKKCENPLGDNNNMLEAVAAKSELIVCAWGAFKEAKERSMEVTKMFPQGMCLGINGDGSPKHPLYIAGNTRLIKYSIHHL